MLHPLVFERVGRADAITGEFLIQEDAHLTFQQELI